MAPSDEMKGFSTYDCSKAFAAGLSFRPLAETARDTLDWYYTIPEEQQQMRTGIDPEKEARVLEAWHAREG
jgi:2'-hydroxyisoflavone reductase